jgi:SAM-dependent MidA family methyltransferase
LAAPVTSTVRGEGGALTDNGGLMTKEAGSVASAMHTLLARAIEREGGWLPFDRYMALALYAPGLGYYSRGSRKFGAMPGSGSDFVTAPELTPLFGRALARQLAQALQVTGTAEVWEFGAGSGALAATLLESLGDVVERYTIVELSASLRQRQQERLRPHAAKVRWIDQLPERIDGVIVGNEVLDAMPVKLLQRTGGVWHERGVSRDGERLLFADLATDLRPPLEIDGAHDYLTEVHPQAQAFVRTLAERLGSAAAFFVDYGFPEAEYYHPQRHMGTLMCHRGHLADPDPLQDPGEKDITAHVDFTGIAVAAQDAGLTVLGYTSQARFLFDCGVLELAADASLAERTALQKLVHEHEMGELFKVIGLGRGAFWDAIGFRTGDRTGRL